MKKIVIITNGSEAGATLIKYLEIIFPECEIEVQSMQAERFRDVPDAPKPSPQKLNPYRLLLQIS